MKKFVITEPAALTGKHVWTLFDKVRIGNSWRNVIRYWMNRNNLQRNPFTTKQNIDNTLPLEKSIRKQIVN